MNQLRLAALALCLPFATANSQTDPDIPIDEIRAATVKIDVTYAVGWQYSGNTWRKGQDEPRADSQGLAGNPKGVRAVCLGKEKVAEEDYYVFFALRSFVDPFYPSPVIQRLGVKAPLDAKGAPIDLGAARPADSGPQSAMSEDQPLDGLIRYGKIKFTWYESQGGGVQNVRAELPVTVFRDPGDVEVFGGKFFGHPYEEYRGGNYPRPQTDFSVKDHFEMQGEADGKRTARLRFYEDHDAVLIYVPKSTFVHHEQPEPHHLGLVHPTRAVDTLLLRTSDLFGFRFVLLGQETLDLVREYRPQEDLDGFEKAFNIVGLALSPETLSLIRSVDDALEDLLPGAEEIESLENLFALYRNLDPIVLVKVGSSIIMRLTGASEFSGGAGSSPGAGQQ